MIRTIAAAIFALVVVTSALFPAFAAGEKTSKECDDNYLDEMANDLDALELLVPNVPPEEVTRQGICRIHSIDGRTTNLRY
jgi:hypothetical protein